MAGRPSPDATNCEISVERMSYKDNRTKQSQDCPYRFNHFDAPCYTTILGTQAIPVSGRLHRAGTRFRRPPGSTRTSRATPGASCYVVDGAARWRVASVPRSSLIERDTDPTRLSPDNVTMMIAVLCGDNQVE
jgi:hypothetical protein